MIYENLQDLKDWLKELVINMSQETIKSIVGNRHYLNTFIRKKSVYCMIVKIKENKPKKSYLTLKNCENYRLNLKNGIFKRITQNLFSYVTVLNYGITVVA